MSIYKAAINRPITTLLIFIAVIILGLFSLRSLPIDLYPEVEPPFVSVIAAFPGANGLEVETNVTRILENSLNSVEGLRELTSVSQDNMAVVTLEFNWGANLDEAVNEVRSAMDMVVNSLPDEVSRPIVFRFNTNMIPILMYAITAEESYAGLEQIIDDNVINALNRIDGVGTVALAGAPQRTIYVDLDPHKLNAFNIGIEQIGQAIIANNVAMPAGSIKMGREQYQLRVENQFVESSEINDIVVSATPDGRQVFIRDLATVRDTIRDISVIESVRGMEGARLFVMTQSGANSVQVVRDVERAIERIQPTLPPDIEFHMIFNTADFIESAISGLSRAVGYALFFVTIVVLFFLGKWRATLIVAIAIPISLIVAFIYLFAIGSSLNIISLASLVIAIGMVVDDAIVILENTNRHVERGTNPKEAAIYGTNEVWVSVVVTTLVIAVVFIPLTMLGGMAGILFKELGWIVTITVVTSTLVAVSLVPMLASKLLKVRKKEQNIAATGGRKRYYKRLTYDSTVVRWLDKVDFWYANLLRWCLGHKWKTSFIILGFFVASLMPALLGQIGTDFMPVNDEGRLTITLELQEGTRVEESAAAATRLGERIVELVPELIIHSFSTGADDRGGIGSLMGSQANNIVQMRLRTTPKYERDRSIFEIADLIREEIRLMPEVITYSVDAGGGGGMGGGGIAVEVFGHDFDVTNAIAVELRDRFRTIEEARDVNISRKPDKAELQVVFDKERLAMHGLNSATAATFVRNRVHGMTAGYLREDGREFEIIIRLQEEFRNSITSIEELTLITPFGRQIQLKEVAEVKEFWSPPNIERKNRERVVTVSVTPAPGVPLSDLVGAVSQYINELEVPPGVMIHIGGDFQEQQEAFADMLLLFLLIIMLVYIVLASQFESFAKPFIIMLSVPFAISGVILALWITSTPLNLVGAMGVILLVGIVTKNGVLLIDFTNLMRDRGHPLGEAIALAGRSRLRPVLMTAFTTILGMIPMVMVVSEGSELWVPLGIVVIGGTTVSTFITLLVVPIFYAIMSRKGERDKKKALRKTFVFFDEKLNEEDMKEIEAGKFKVE